MPDGPVEKRPARARPHDPDTTRAEQTRRDIIQAAWAEFVEHGLSGASVNTIAARTRTTKPMIYYYFGSKEGLYAAVMEEAYGGMRDVEQGLALDHLSPADAMRRLVEATFDYHASHPDWVRLISTENIHHARHIKASPTIAQRNAAVIGIVGALLERGARSSVFRTGIDPADLHLLISSICFHRVSNRYTWAVIFGRDLQAPEVAAAQRRMAVEAVLAYVSPGAGAPAGRDREPDRDAGHPMPGRRGTQQGGGEG